MQGWRHWVALAIIVVGLPVIMGQGCQGPAVLGINESTEIRIGQQGASQIESQYGVVTDPAWNARVTRIGRSLAAVSTRPNLPWRFRILNVPEINAAALPGGPVYVTRGLMALNLPDAELAAVIAHEVAHIQNRDSVRAIQRAMTYELVSDLVLGNSRATQMAADLAIQYGVQLPHSRADEYAADALGIKLAYNAGYAPGGMVAFLQRLNALSAGQPSGPAWARTHPLTSDRIARASQLTAQVATQARPVPVVLTEAEAATVKALEDEKAEGAALDAPMPAQEEGH